ncbi:regulatory LuxR family protein [Kribbella orskensis]|uniref:Regulatory LuxR family protein n=1 Tax=Kribbella orskensis TaxID=2512216 RepID=A0ABY2BE11_9ACTN|nr:MULTISPECIES: LuxR family transcriptional regulator [Kribbella]TCN35470.1 regulatory LuxR family protein [Kribbella sp. VKM Ac-2500]TCO17012.1 regulatory LuxR family protein [Kribbella orskensis]
MVESRPLRGRSEQLGLALSAVRRVRAIGASGVVLVTGAPGIGKTAVLTEICRQAAVQRFRVARTKCDEIEQVSPGAPVIAVLRSGRDPLISADDYEHLGQIEPLVLADRIATYLEKAAAGGPLVIAIDDLHWADRVSLFLLRSLIPRLIGLPVLWVLTSRDRRLKSELESVDHVRFHHLLLTPLTAPDLAAMAHDRLGGVPSRHTQQLLAASDGNPFLAVQIIDGIARTAGREDAVPAEFTAAIHRRLSELDPTVRWAVELLAVAGRTLPIDDLVLLQPELTPELVGDAILSGLVAETSGTLSFRHDLIRETVSATIAGRTVRGLHLRIADHLLRVAGQELLAASHVKAATIPGDLGSALILTSAAEQLTSISPDDASELAMLAFGTLRPSHDRWFEIGQRCLAVLARTQHVAETLTVADQLLARADEAEVIGQVETVTARALWLGGQVAELTERCDRVLRLPGLAPAIAARLTAARALAQTRMIPGAQAADGARMALATAQAAGDQEAITLALQACGEAAKNEGRHRASLGYFRDLRPLLGTSYLAEEIIALQLLDRYEHAQTLLDQARKDSESAVEGALPALAYAQVWQDFNLGRLDDAGAGALGLIELGRQLGTSVHALEAMMIHAAVQLARGEYEAADRQVEAAARLTDADENIREPAVPLMRGWLAATRGDLDRATAILRPLLDTAAESRTFWPWWPGWTAVFYEIGTAAGEPKFARQAVDLAELGAERNPGVISFEGLALNLRGRAEDDLALVARSAEVLASSPRPALLAVGAASYGRALLAAGDRDAGMVQLDRAWDVYHAMGSLDSRNGVEATMRRAGARRTKWDQSTARPATGWEALTDAEQRVAKLIAAGHTNKSAASTLGISINTVGTHLRAVFAKLGIQSRVQLANTLNAHPGETREPDG